MRRVSRFELAVVWACTLGSSCTDESVARLPPNLIALEIVDPVAGPQTALPGVDAGMAPPVSPLSSIRATFDALLDPSKVQNLSGTTAAPGAGVGKVSWAGATGVTELGLLAEYNPSKRQNFGAAPTLTFTPPAALPAGVRLTFTLSRDRITDKQGRPYVGVTSATFDTQPFIATVALPAAALSPSSSVRIAFSSAPAAAVSGAVRVFAGATEVPVEVRVEAGARHVWVVSPRGEGVPWPSGPHRLVLAAGLITDVFGMSLAPGPSEFPFLVGGTTDADVAGGALDTSATDAPSL